MPFPATLNFKDATPIVRQYIDIKKQYQDALVFFGIGDFYELFFNDAEIAARELDITLTRKAAKNISIPMAGVPYHAYEIYLARLVKAGFKVAICEQQQTPLEAKQQKKDVVDRAVVRVVTPGTVTEEALLLDGSYNYLAAVYLYKNNVAIAWVDISTGNFYIESADKNELHNILFRINPKEILLAEKDIKLLEEELKALVTIVSEEKFNFISNQKELEQFFQINFVNSFNEAEIITSGVLLGYLILTQKSIMPQLTVPKVWQQKDVMRLDFFTRRSLEIDKKLNGEYKGSLRAAIDKTQSKEGKRLLQEWLSAPLVKVEAINERLAAVEYFCSHKDLLKSITDTLKSTPDLIRTFTKLVLNRGGPRDLFALKQALNTLVSIRGGMLGKDIPNLIKTALLKAGDFSFLLTELERALKDFEELPLTVKAGSFVRANYRQELEFFKNDIKTTFNEILALEQEYTVKAKVPVKIQHNNLLGRFVEVSSKNADKVMEKKELFIHKQTLAGCARFTTKELMDKEAKALRVQAKIDAFEQIIFDEFIRLINNNKENIFNASKAIALVDVLTAFANLALEYNFIKPIVNNSNNIKIVAGRHPVVEQGLKLQEEKLFIANDCLIDSNGYIFIITGPNMAGKSTFLRQNAIIVILAQIGCYVPAESAEIGVVDAVFSRVGASDNLYKGQSTFMVEMVETATILTNATAKSFIILDEIGRGTATYDGLSIAFAVLYYLHNVVRAKVLFATHYHELTKLKHELKHLKTSYMKVANQNNELVFMHNVVSGVANKSYGIYAAKLAGMPKMVVNKAENYLALLEQQIKAENNLPLFSNTFTKEIDLTEEETNNAANNSLQTNSEEKNNNDLICSSLQEKTNLKLLEKISNLKLDEITPKQALEFLYDLKKQIIE